MDRKDLEIIGWTLMAIALALVATIAMSMIEPVHGENHHFYTLIPTDNITEALALQSVLNEAHYQHNYNKGYFDCSDMSIYTNMYLREHGFNASALINYNQTHMWIGVKEPDGWLFVETTMDPQRQLGAVVWKDIGNYTTGMLIDDPLGYVASLGDSVQPSYSINDLEEN